MDYAGNRLDGEMKPSSRTSTPVQLAQRGRHPGGDFVARFTVDSRPEIGRESFRQRLGGHQRQLSLRSG